MKKAIFIFILLFIVIPFSHVCADDGLRLSITPPLIKNNVSPGQLWKSSVKLVNNNNQEINVYVEVQDFKSGTENGTVEFLPPASKNAEKDMSMLSSWIIVEPRPIEIPPQSSVDIPFLIDVPATAGPGGHYAAILAGTRPPEGTAGGSSIKVSSLLGSLILLNVKGDVKEQGQILSFSSEKGVYQKPEVNFNVRFQNTGNVHIQPQGEIRVYNWLNQDKGFMTLNRDSDFGNVLPGGTRKWEFPWKIEDSPLAMGRYRALLIVGYGEMARQTESREFYFWVLNFKLIGIVGGIGLMALLLVIYLIKAYVRRAIKKTQEQVDLMAKEMSQTRQRINVMPEKAKVVDLKQNIKTVSRPADGPEKNQAPKSAEKPKKAFAKKLLRFLGMLVIIAIIAGGAYIFFNNRNQASKGKANPIVKEKAESEKSNENAYKEKAASSTDVIPPKIEKEPLIKTEPSTSTEAVAAPNGPVTKIDKKDVSIIILNGTGAPGIASRASNILTQSGYKISKMGNAASYNFQITEIKYKKNYKDFANVITDLLAVDVGLKENDSIEGDVIITLGKDFK
jgi:hypothetical protein